MFYLNYRREEYGNRGISFYAFDGQPSVDQQHSKLCSCSGYFSMKQQYSYYNN